MDFRGFWLPIEVVKFVVGEDISLMDMGVYLLVEAGHKQTIEGTAIDQAFVRAAQMSRKSVRRSLHVLESLGLITLKRNQETNQLIAETFWRENDRLLHVEALQEVARRQANGKSKRGR